MTTMIRSPNAARQDALARVSYPIIRLSRYGVATGSGNATANRTAIQAAINDAIAAKTWLVNDMPDGTYDVAKAGSANPYHASTNYCLNLGDGTTNFRIVQQNPNAILRIAPSQMSGSTTYCNFFTGRDLKNCVISGTYDCGSLQQPGWTGGYGQMTCLGFFFISTASGGGCQNLTFRDLDVRNVFGNPVGGPYSEDGRRTSGTIRFDNCRCKNVGEGWEVNFARMVQMRNCLTDNTAGTMVGDFYEFSSCERVDLDECHTYSATTSGVGSHIECYGSKHVTVRNSRFVGGNDPVGMESSPSGQVESVLFEDCTFSGLNIGYGPPRASRLVFRGCSFKNCGSDTNPCLQSGNLNSDNTSVVGAVIEVDGGTFDACGPIYATRNGTLVMKNKPVVSNALANAINATRFDSSIPTLDIDVIVRNPVGHCLQIDGQGTSFSPRGVVRGQFTGAVDRRQIININSGHADDLIIDVDIPEASPSLSRWEMIGYKQFVDPNDDPGNPAADPGADYLRGSKGQIVEFIGRAASRAFAASSRMRYLGATSLTLTEKTRLKALYLGNRIWQELERQVAS